MTDEQALDYTMETNASASQLDFRAQLGEMFRNAPLPKENVVK